MINKVNSFTLSAKVVKGAMHDTQSVIKWVKDQNEMVEVSVNKIGFSELKGWSFIDDKSKLVHQSGGFFSIEGISVSTNWGEVPHWEQPIINQPEIGYLGFITKEFDGILYFLVQAKVEPGNVNNVQLSPTLQATKSNYTQKHKGKPPLYLDYFVNTNSSQILLDQLQSEQGARFLKKRNRNIIIKVEEEIVLHNNFIWLTLGQIKELMSLDNLVNMDTRTVISGISYIDYDKSENISRNQNLTVSNSDSFGAKVLQSYLFKGTAVNTIDGIISFITSMKSTFDLDIKKISLADIKGWEIIDKEIRHENSQYFKVIPVDVRINSREVINWTQPMIEPSQEGICAFIAKEINGVLHFIVQAKLECGNFDIIELAPTVQCITGNYRQTASFNLPFLNYVLKDNHENVVIDCLQSEEGGRFYKEQNRNIIIIAGDEIDDVLPSNYIWMTLNQLQLFNRFNNYLNIQARSLLAALPIN
jgi:oxidase EvaA